jgi:transcriptional regulator with XRE-family HTH domain
MTSRATTLGDFIAELMAKHHYSNRSLAAEAGISEGAVRNILRYGIDARAKDPDARTLLQLATALGVNPLRLYRLAGYLPPSTDTHSVRAAFVADIFDELSPDKQDAVLGVVEAMARTPRKKDVEEMRDDSRNPLAGVDLANPGLARIMANDLIAHYQIQSPHEIERIEPDAVVHGHKWSSLPQATQVRVKALIEHKLALDYDPTMVDPKWRK